MPQEIIDVDFAEIEELPNGYRASTPRGDSIEVTFHEIGFLGIFFPLLGKYVLRIRENGSEPYIRDVVWGPMAGEEHARKAALLKLESLL
jgi:hypothetical protein